MWPSYGWHNGATLQPICWRILKQHFGWFDNGINVRDGLIVIWKSKYKCQSMQWAKEAPCACLYMSLQIPCHTSENASNAASPVLTESFMQPAARMAKMVSCRLSLAESSDPNALGSSSSASEMKSQETSLVARTTRVVSALGQDTQQKSGKR